MNADNRIIAGPESPECVMRTGPSTAEKGPAVPWTGVGIVTPFGGIHRTRAVATLRNGRVVYSQ